MPDLNYYNITLQFVTWFYFKCGDNKYNHWNFNFVKPW